MIKIIGPRDVKKYQGQEIINTTSSSPNWSKGLSPFFLGPVNLYDGKISKNMENAWQFSKVYEGQVDEQNNPTQNYWDWANFGWKDSIAHRYPMGKGKLPLYSFWKGQKLDYIKARKEIYIPLYLDCVLKTDAFKKLLKIYKEKGSVILFDFDGYEWDATKENIYDVVNNPDKKMGHAFVLALALLSS